MTHEAYIQPGRVVGKRDIKIYGHFLEHFHRQIYGGVFDPGSRLSNGQGLRTDVLAALKRIGTPIIRWPGGCYVSAYHWKDGVGHPRVPSFDKAWRVEESNAFGTDEFMALCRAIDTEPYICTNAGSGSPEEMSDWVEYCNLGTEGKWARARIANGHEEPYKVKYWSIGNENYLPGEIGSKSASEWCRFVRESAKMMKRVDPTIQLLAASVADIDWNVGLLREAGGLLDWISIHGYWDPLWQDNNLSSYEACMAQTMAIEETIQKAEHILGVLGYLGKIKIAFDEWNLRGWHHPNVDAGRTPEAYLLPRDENDRNEDYTMADAVFNACFLNQCLKHCNTVGMANFAPVVNTRGAIFTHENGLVLRPTYHVFDLYANHMGDTVVDSWLASGDVFEVSTGGRSVRVPALDLVATRSGGTNDLRIAIVNRHPDMHQTIRLHMGATTPGKYAKLHTLAGSSKDACNCMAHPDNVTVTEQVLPCRNQSGLTVELPPHSVNVLVQDF
jgi:alpha-N-arabinofuranosidase